MAKDRDWETEKRAALATLSALREQGGLPQKQYEELVREVEAMAKKPDHIRLDVLQE